MADDAFLAELSRSLHEFGADVERTSLPALKSNLTSLRTSFESLVGLLKKKGLLSDDPYQYSEKISQIRPVPADPYMENQKNTVVSVRMHHFENQLAFLTDTFYMTLESLSLSQMRSLTQLLRYVRWESLSETHAEANTKLVAELVGKVRKSDDAVTTGLANDMVHQISLNSAKVFDALKRVNVYKREEYKHLVRSSFWSGLRFAAEEVQGNAENVMGRVKKEFAAHLKGQPFIPELIKELLEEDFSPSSAHLKEETLLRLKVVKSVVEKPKIEVDPRVDLMEAVRTLATANVPLEIGIRKLHESAALMDTAQDGLGDRLRKWFRSLMGIRPKPRLIVIDLFDPGTGATKREPLDFDAFQTALASQIRILTGMANRNGASFIALSQKPEDEILAWFERQFIDVAKAVERINGVDVYFKTEVPKEKRAQVKGTKSEVAQIRTIMGNANKLRHEAVGRREEQEQLKRLGVR